MRKACRTIALLAIAGLAVAAQPTAGSALQWPWAKKDRPVEDLPAPAPLDAAPLPPAAVGPAPLDQAPVGVAPVVPQNDVFARLDRAEATIRDLTGQVEQLGFQLRETQQELQRVQASLGVAPTASNKPVAPPKQIDAVGAVASAAPEPQPAPAAAPEPIDVKPRAQDQPIDLTAMARQSDQAGQGAAVERPAPQVVSLGDPGADYERAYNSILSGDYEMAEASFRTFLSTYPNDQRASDAQYWLGESLFARGDYRDAADEFLSGYKAYPKSIKAPDTLLKLGLSLAGLGEREAACSTYAEVLKKYPQTSNALRQRVATEQAVARC